MTDRFVVLALQVKIDPLDDPGVEQHVIVDLFLVPCEPRCRENPRGEDFEPGDRPPMLFVDDVSFRVIPKGHDFGPLPVTCAVLLPIEELTRCFGPPPFSLD